MNFKITAFDKPSEVAQPNAKPVLPEGCYLLRVLDVDSAWSKAQRPLGLNIFAGLKTVQKILKDRYTDNAGKLESIDAYVDTLFVIRHTVTAPGYAKTYKTEEQAEAACKAMNEANKDTADYIEAICEASVAYACTESPMPFGFFELVAIRTNIETPLRLDQYRKLVLTTFWDNGELRTLGQPGKEHIDIYSLFPVLVTELYPTMAQFENPKMAPYEHLTSLGASKLFGQFRIIIDNPKTHNAIRGTYVESDEFHDLVDLTRLVGKNIVQYRYSYTHYNGKTEWDWRFLPRYDRTDITAINFKEASYINRK